MTNAARDGKDFEPPSEAGQVRNAMVSWIADLAQWHKESAELIRGQDSLSPTYESHLRNASRLGELADFLETLPDDDPLIKETRVARRWWHDRRIGEWLDYMAEFAAADGPALAEDVDADVRYAAGEDTG